MKKTSKYVINNHPVPGVTSILSVIAKPGLYKWYADNGWQKCKEISDTSKRFGTLLHETLEQRTTGQKLALNEPLKTAVENFDLVTKGWVWKEAEKVLLNEEHLFGGTLDAIAEINGVPHVIDYKTTSDGRTYPEHKLQVSAYMKCVGIEKAKILYFNKETKGWSMVEVEQSPELFNTFLAAKTIWEWANS